MSDNFEVKNKITEAVLKDLGEELKKRMPEGMGFVLLMADFGEKGATFYTSSIVRQDAINLLKEFVQKLEEQQ